MQFEVILYFFFFHTNTFHLHYTISRGFGVLGFWEFNPITKYSGIISRFLKCFSGKPVFVKASLMVAAVVRMGSGADIWAAVGCCRLGSADIGQRPARPR